MKYCVNCGAQLTDESRFCGCCGAQVKAAVQPAVTAAARGQAPANNAQQAASQASNVYATAYSSQQAKNISLDIINRAIKHFTPYSKEYKEYYKIASTSFVNANRIPVLWLVLAAIVANVLIGWFQFYYKMGATARVLAISLLVMGILVIVGAIALIVILQLRRGPLKARLIELDNILMKAYNSFPEKSLFGPEYSLPALMNYAKMAIETGRANTVPEAIAFVRRDIIGIYKSTSDQILRHACTSRVYRKYTDRIKDANGNRALRFIME